MKKIIKNCNTLIYVITAGVILGGGVAAVEAWTEPGGAAPTGNLGAPINVGSTGQIKAGSFTSSNFIKSDSPTRRFYWGDASIIGDNDTALSFYSNNSAGSQLLLRNSGGVSYGRLYGSTDASSRYNFGLVNTDGEWSYQDIDDVATYFRRGNSIKMTILENGLIGIGNTSPAYSLDVTGGIHATNNMLVGGNINVGGIATATEFVYSSDERLKNNIRTLQNTKDVLNIAPVRFDWKKDERADIGVIAQEVEKYFPEFVNTGEDGFKAVNYPKLVVPLIGAVKEQQKKIDELEKRLEALENK